MRALLDRQTSEVAKLQFLGDLRVWCATHHKPLTAKTFYDELFPNGCLRDGISLPSMLRDDDRLPLQTELGILFVDPTHVMRNHPDLLEAIAHITGISLDLRETLVPSPVPLIALAPAPVSLSNNAQ